MSLMSTRWRGICDQMQVLSRKRGHCDPRSAITYHITERVLGQQLQADMFGKNVADAVIGKGEKWALAEEDESSEQARPPKNVRFEHPNDSNNQAETNKTDYGSNSGATEVPASKESGSNDYIRKETGTTSLLNEVSPAHGVAETLGGRTGGVSSNFGGNLELFSSLKNVHSLTVNIYQHPLRFIKDSDKWNKDWRITLMVNICIHDDFLFVLITVCSSWESHIIYYVSIIIFI